MDNIPKKGTKEYAIADALSRQNAMSGLYKKIGFPLEWKHINKRSSFEITKSADLADNIIAEAIENDKDIGNKEVQEEMLSAFYGGTSGILMATKMHKLRGLFNFRKAED